MNALRRELRQVSPLQVLAVAWVIAFSAVIGWVIVRQAGESTRLREAIVAEQARQAEEAERRTRSQCSGWKEQAAVDVQPATTDLGRVVIRTAAANYSDPSFNCIARLGPLPDVDPAAYRPAPDPAGPTPGR